MSKFHMLKVDLCTDMVLKAINMGHLTAMHGLF